MALWVTCIVICICLHISIFVLSFIVSKFKRKEKKISGQISTKELLFVYYSVYGKRASVVSKGVVLLSLDMEITGLWSVSLMAKKTPEKLLIRSS